jgi:hypothetical protein
LQKCFYIFAISVYLSMCDNSRIAEWIFTKSDFREAYYSLSKRSQVWLQKK